MTYDLKSRVKRKAYKIYRILSIAFAYYKACIKKIAQAFVVMTDITLEKFGRIIHITHQIFYN